MTLDILPVNETFYLYFLRCVDGSRYYGHTADLCNRLSEHRKGFVKSTKDKNPVEIIYFEEKNTRSEAFKREMQFKNGKTRKTTIERLIKTFSQAKCQGLNSASDLRSSRSGGTP